MIYPRFLFLFFLFVVIGGCAGNPKEDNNLLMSNRSSAFALVSDLNATATQDRPFLADPNFDPSNLSAEMHTWYDRLKSAIASSQSRVATRAASGNLYFIGRDTNEQVTALIDAMRATGSIEFLTQAAELMESARSALRNTYACADLRTEGTHVACVEPVGCSSGNCCTHETTPYSHFLWLGFFPKDNYAFPTSPDYVNQEWWCQDKHPMDEAMTHGNIAVLAYALQVNRSFDSALAEKADFWTDYLLNHYMEKWKERGAAPHGIKEGFDAFYKHLTHPVANSWRIAYYLYRLTGDPAYLERAHFYAAMEKSVLTINSSVPSAYTWTMQTDPRTPGQAFSCTANDSANCPQNVYYAQYFMDVAYEIHSEQFASNLGPYFSDNDMARLTSTWRDVVFAPSFVNTGHMAFRVDGTPNDVNGNPYALTMFGLSGLSRFDTTGRLAQLSEANYSADSSGAGVRIAGHMLFALSRRMGRLSATPSPTPTAVGSSSAAAKSTSENPFVNQSGCSANTANLFFCSMVLGLYLWRHRFRTRI